MEAEPLSALPSAAQWPDSAQEAVALRRDGAQGALVRAETMRDPNARRMMRELAMHYETLALRVENATLALRVRNTDLQSSSAGDRKSKRVQVCNDSNEILAISIIYMNLLK